jgi:hypothetical protein
MKHCYVIPGLLRDGLKKRQPGRRCPEPFRVLRACSLKHSHVIIKHENINM